MVEEGLLDFGGMLCLAGRFCIPSHTVLQLSSYRANTIWRLYEGMS